MPKHIQEALISRAYMLAGSPQLEDQYKTTITYRRVRYQLSIVHAGGAIWAYVVEMATGVEVAAFELVGQ